MKSALFKFNFLLRLYTLPMDRFSAAEEYCTELISLDCNNPKVYFIRANARAKLGKLELAVAGESFKL